MPVNPDPAEPASPCVRLCTLDARGICLGCGRSLDEITVWSAADAATKGAILRAAGGRLALALSRPHAGS